MKSLYEKPYDYRYRSNYTIERNRFENTRYVHQKKRKTVSKVSIFHRAVSLSILLFIGLVILPYSYGKLARPAYNSFKSFKTVADVDYSLLYDKTSAIVYNDSFYGKRILVSDYSSKTKIQSMTETDEMAQLKDKLIELGKIYPAIQPSVYVWDYKTGRYLDLNADKSYSAASIIKIPVLLNLFKAIEAGEISLKDRFILKDVFRASGSGDLQFKAENSTYTVDELARRMMRDSDNTATNILMYLTGGSNRTNRLLRKWGLKTTRVRNWLPDLEGDNKTTAREMATLLFNVDNPKFLSLASREYVIDYLSDIRNNRLLKAGLPEDALLIHKTGDIGKMLGDAGVVYTSKGERYIVVILVNRPYNSPEGKDFIVNASSIIYHHMTNGKM